MRWVTLTTNACASAMSVSRSPCSFSPARRSGRWHQSGVAGWPHTPRRRHSAFHVIRCRGTSTSMSLRYSTPPTASSYCACSSSSATCAYLAAPPPPPVREYGIKISAHAARSGNRPAAASWRSGSNASPVKAAAAFERRSSPAGALEHTPAKLAELPWCGRVSHRTMAPFSGAQRQALTVVPVAAGRLRAHAAGARARG